MTPQFTSNRNAVTEFAKRVKACPAEGEGVHKWMFHAACVAVETGMSDDEAAEEIEFRMTRAPNPPSEIIDALRSARGERRRSTPRWSPINPAAIAEIVKNGPTLLELISCSPEPIRFVPQSRAEMFIDALFPGNPWLCVGASSSCFRTDLRENLRGRLHLCSLIVPSPMSARRGRTKQGKSSSHSEANTGPRRYLVVEFDRGTLDQQAALLWHLAAFAPLALVVFSGGKSAHGWFFCEGQPEDKLQRFFDYAVSLGADSRTWLRSQFVRMPDGKRTDGKTSDALKLTGIDGVPSGRQAVLYFNPGVIR
jgi:hypothetical protein